MNEQNNIENSIKKWVIIDNEYKKIYSQLTNLREQKHNIEERLFNHYDSQNIKYPLINISDGKLSLIQLKQHNILSFTFLEECFKEFFKDYENSNVIENELIMFIKSKRTFKTNNLIKRTYNTKKP